MFGKIVEGEMRISAIGQIVSQCWTGIPKHFPHVELDVYVVMPNHVHGIIKWYDNEPGRGLINQTPTDAPTLAKGWNLMKDPRRTLGKIIRHYKARTSKIIRDVEDVDFHWQRNYYDHIIRGEKDYHAIQEYIINNPLQWFYDEENPDIQNTK